MISKVLYDNAAYSAQGSNFMQGKAVDNKETFE